jgi:hypothetical protein
MLKGTKHERLKCLALAYILLRGVFWMLDVVLGPQERIEGGCANANII